MKNNIIKRINLIVLSVFLISIFKIPLQAKANEILTPIMGQAVIGKEKLKSELLKSNPNKTKEYVEDFVETLFQEAQAEGVRADVAFAQIMKETGYLKFTGTVKEQQNNFGGIGTTGQIDPNTGQPVPGNSFPDIRTGLRVNIQHLKAYASKEKLVKAKVDPRFDYVQRGVAQYVEWLGTNENPNKAGWATSVGYGYDIVNIINRYINTTYTAQNANFTIDNSEKIFTGNKYTVTGGGNSKGTILYQYWILDKNANKWDLLKDWNTDNKLFFAPANEGNYRIELHIKDQTSNKNYDSLYFKDIEVKEEKYNASNARFTINSDKYYKGNKYEINGQGDAVHNIMYQYWALDKQTDNWIMLSDWTYNNIMEWCPENDGNYRIEMHIKDEKSKKNYDAICYKDLSVNKINFANNAKFTTNTESYYFNKEINIQGTAISQNNILYQYWALDKKNNNWILINDWSNNGTVSWIPRTGGQYRLELHTKDEKSKNNYDSLCFKDINIGSNGTASNPNIDMSTYTHYTNESFDIIGSGKADNEVLYQFWALDKENDNWILLRDWDVNNKFSWNILKKGDYRLEMHIKDRESKKNYDCIAYYDIVAKNKTNASAVSLAINNQNGNYKIQANGKSENEIYYQYWILDKSNGIWTMLQDWTRNNIVQWKPDNKRQYRVEVHAKDITSSKNYDVLSYQDINVHTPVIVIDPGHNKGVGSGASAKHNGITYDETDLNMQVALKLKDELSKRGYTVMMTRTAWYTVYLNAGETYEQNISNELQRRADWASMLKADFFISIHHDSIGEAGPSGISTHFSSFRPSLDNDGIYSPAGGRDPLSGMNFTNLKIDSTPSVPAQKSRDYAINLANALSSRLGYNNGKARDHALKVNKDIDIPSVLVECGFLSNPSDAARAANSDNQKAFATVMADEFDKIFK